MARINYGNRELQPCGSTENHTVCHCLHRHPDFGLKVQLCGVLPLCADVGRIGAGCFFRQPDTQNARAVLNIRLCTHAQSRAKKSDLTDWAFMKRRTATKVGSVS